MTFYQQQDGVTWIPAIIMQEPSSKEMFFIPKIWMESGRVKYPQNDTFYRYLENEPQATVFEGVVPIDFNQSPIPKSPDLPVYDQSKLTLPGWLIRIDVDHNYFFAFDFMRILFRMTSETYVHMQPLAGVFFPMPIQDHRILSKGNTHQNKLKQTLYHEISIEEEHHSSLPATTCVIIVVE